MAVYLREVSIDTTLSSENDWPGEQLCCSGGQPDGVHGGAVNTNGVLSLEAAAAAARCQADGSNRPAPAVQAGSRGKGKVWADQRRTCGCFVL